jgi:bifunctional ADP-heptose synthase (sugar kinase/adenylyltransferase)
MAILVIGEECKDVFIYGKCERLSPEAPVPVFQPIRTVENRGMAGNVIENLFALNSRSYYTVYQCVSRPRQIVKTRYVDEKSNHIFLRVDEENPETIDRFKPDFCFEKMMFSADCIIVSDYNKGYLSEDDLIRIALLKKPHQTLIVDSKRVLPVDVMKCADFVKMNQSEYLATQNAYPLGVLEDYYRKIIVTLGGDGADYMGKRYSVDTKQTIDVSGAGDTFVAAFANEYMDSYDVEKAIRFANEMSAIVVTKRGVATP